MPLFRVALFRIAKRWEKTKGLSTNEWIKELWFIWRDIQFSSVQLLSRVRLFVTPWTAAHQASLSITNSGIVLKLMCIELVMPSNHLILSSPSPPASIFPSIRVFSNESVPHIRWPKYWSFSLNISPFNEHSGLISFGSDWFDHLAFQGTLKSANSSRKKEAAGPKQKVSVLLSINKVFEFRNQVYIPKWYSN